MDISFLPLTNADLEDYPIVIRVEIRGHDIHKMYTDRGSASEILYKHCFLRLRPEVRSRLVPATMPLTRYDRSAQDVSCAQTRGKRRNPYGQIEEAWPSTKEEQGGK
ncbi:hypothetical protein Tco_1207754 [Tanacetum coccineum]